MVEDGVEVVNGVVVSCIERQRRVHACGCYSDSVPDSSEMEGAGMWFGGSPHQLHTLAVHVCNRRSGKQGTSRIQYEFRCMLVCLACKKYDVVLSTIACGSSCSANRCLTRPPSGSLYSEVRAHRARAPLRLVTSPFNVYRVRIAILRHNMIYSCIGVLLSLDT